MRYEPRHHAARSTTEYVFHQLLPYLGNKRNLLDLIAQAITATGCDPHSSSFVDAFAGSGVVARFARQLGFAVVANDWEPYSHTINTAALLHDEPPTLHTLDGYERAISYLNELKGTDGWVARTLCPADDEAPDPKRERMFYRRANGRRFDAIREQIHAWQQDGTCNRSEAACLLAPLLYQACWLANTSGVFKGFHAGWGGKNGTALHRILADLKLIPLQFAPSERPHRVLAMDALELPTALPQALPNGADIAYLDPPYNQHPYASNYHVLNSLVLWDQPELPPATERGFKAGIRSDWSNRRSAFNHRHPAANAMRQLLERLDAKHLLISYSTDGMIPLDTLIADACKQGRLTIHCRSYKRYRTSPTRPSPRPRNVEFVLHVDRTQSPRPQDQDQALAQLQAHT